MELSKMTAMEAKLDAIMHRMDKQERKMHTAHEIGAVERELMRRSADVPTEEDSYGAEEVKYVNEQRSYHFKPNPNLPTHYNPALRNHDNFSYGGGHYTAQGRDNILNKDISSHQGSSSSSKEVKVEMNIRVRGEPNHLKNKCCSPWGTTRGYYNSMNRNYLTWKLSSLILTCFRRMLVPH